MSAKDRLIRATAWHAAGRVTAGLLGLANAAWAFHALGPERYGLLALVAAFNVALVLVDLGLRTSTVRFVAEDAGRGGAAPARASLGAATLLHLAAGALVAAPFVVFAREAAGLLGVAEGLRGEAAALLRVMAVSLVLGNAASNWTSVLVALQRTGPVAAGMVAGGAAQLAGTVLAARGLGWGAPSLGAGFAAGLAVRAAVEAVAAGRALPGVSILPWHATREALRRLLALGMHLQAAVIADVVVFRLDQVLVARFLGLEVAGAYRLASDLVLKVRDAPLLLAAGVLPAATEVREAEGGQALRSLYLRGTKYVVAAAFLAVAFLAAASLPLMEAAGGAAAAAGAPVFAVLLAGVAANVSTGVGTQVAVAVGRTDLLTRAGLASAAVSAVAVPLALLAGGGPGLAAAGTALSLWAGAVVFLAPFHRGLGIPAGEAARVAYLPPILPALGVAAAVLALHRVSPLGALLEGASRATILAVLGVEGIALGAAYAGVLAAAGWFDAYDRDVLRRLLLLAYGGAPR